MVREKSYPGSPLISSHTPGLVHLMLGTAFLRGIHKGLRRVRNPEANAGRTLPWETVKDPVRKDMKGDVRTLLH